MSHKLPGLPMTLLYFYLLPASFFHELLRPALTRSWAQRRFAPCLPLAAHLREHGPELPADCLLCRLEEGLSFSRHAWHGLIGECLLFGSVDVPRLQTAPRTLCCILAPENYHAGDLPRERFAAIQQVHLGSRDLHFGGYYRPEHAGYNDRSDVLRLQTYLRAQEPQRWRAEDLTPLPELATAEERAEELADVRDWWPALVELYQRAATEDLIEACEEV
jgi:hypothetical protein